MSITLDTLKLPGSGPRMPSVGDTAELQSVSWAFLRAANTASLICFWNVSNVLFALTASFPALLLPAARAAAAMSRPLGAGGTSVTVDRGGAN